MMKSCISMRKSSEMNNNKTILTSVVGTLVVVVSALALLIRFHPDLISVLVFHGVHKSHIAENIPSQEDFDRVLLQQLSEHFMQELNEESLIVEYELLREGPTQTGVAYPKYYAWVTVQSKDAVLLLEGAARIAAIDKQSFDVVDFLSVSDIEKTPIKIYRVFPNDVASEIDQRVFGVF